MIKVHNLHKSFGRKHVLKGVSFEIFPGDTLAIIGKSGTGKSVLLKLIVGLLEPDEGWVEIEGKRVDRMSAKELYEVRKKIGYVFQGAALFDSMTVYENLTLSLKEHREADQGETEQEVRKRLTNVGLLPDPEQVAKKEYEQAWKIISRKKPAELSGGMRKRVGVARALIGSPSYVFYDEPTTGLDPVTSKQIDDLICELDETLNVTALLITHDIFTVWNVADRVIMLHNGTIRFEGTAKELRDVDDDIVREFVERYSGGEKAEMRDEG